MCVPVEDILWKGKRLKDYSKEDLIDICADLIDSVHKRAEVRITSDFRCSTMLGRKCNCKTDKDCKWSDENYEKANHGQSS